MKDNGIGIDPQFQDRVFGVFRRLREKEAPGSGIGLALCKRIVEHYGGAIWVESKKNEGRHSGSRFRERKACYPRERRNERKNFNCGR